jgi:hypothetical protein
MLESTSFVALKPLSLISVMYHLVMIGERHRSPFPEGAGNPFGIRCHQRELLTLADTFALPKWTSQPLLNRT